MQEADQRLAAGNEARLTRAWKLFLLLPRVLLHKPARGRLVPKEELRRRFNLFAQGWEELIIASRQCDEVADKAAVRRRRRQQGDTVEKRADRALDLVHMGELSAARHALEGDPIAPGNQQTLRALQDPNRRPAVLRSPLPPAILNQVPEVEFNLSQEGLLANLRSSRLVEPQA